MCIACFSVIFAVKFFQAAFPAHNSTYSVLNAFVVGIGGSVSSISGGVLSDYVGNRFGYHVRMFVLLWCDRCAVVSVNIILLFFVYAATAHAYARCFGN